MKSDQPAPRPYSLTPKQCEQYFGYKPTVIYNLITAGRLTPDYHYLKIRKKVLIIVDRFIEWLHEQNKRGGNDEC